MRSDTIAALNAKFEKFPFLRSDEVSLDEIARASISLGFSFPSDYVEFIQRFGGAMVGPYPVFGLRAAEPMGTDDKSVVDVTHRYREQRVPETENWLVISRDHSGNPIGLALDGQVYTWNHDHRQTLRIANSFEHFLRKECLKLPD